MTEPSIQPAGDHSEAILQSTVERLKARGDARRFSCMSLPTPLFNDLCARLLDRKIPVRHTAEWLAGQIADAPTRSSVERFAQVLFDEYRLCELDQDRAEASRFAEAASGGDPDAMQMAFNERLTQLLAGEVLRVKSGENIDTKRLATIIFGARTVAKNAMDKRAIDVRIESLQGQIRLRDTAIQLYEQRLQKLPERLKAIEAKLESAEKARAEGRFDARIYELIREELCKVREDVQSPSSEPPQPTPEPTVPAEADLRQEARSRAEQTVETVRSILGIKPD